MAIMGAPGLRRTENRGVHAFIYVLCPQTNENSSKKDLAPKRREQLHLDPKLDAMHMSNNQKTFHRKGNSAYDAH